MTEMSKEGFANLEDLCRMCLELPVEAEEPVEITKEIRNSFFELTELELLDDEGRQTICQQCYSGLNFCSEFRRNLIAKQQGLKKLLEPKEPPAGKREDPLANFVHVKEECFSVRGSRPADVERSQSPETVESSSVNQNHQAQTYSCHQCSYEASSSHHLSKHLLKSHSSSLPRSKLKTQEKGFSKTRKQCPTCGIFVKNLPEHQKIVHFQEKRFCCDFCNYSCYFKTKITRHIQKHIPKHLREQFPCEVPDCGFFATRKDALKSHILTMHQSAREKVFLCIECGKNFYKKSQLNIHVKAVHEKIKNHLCNLCGKSFFNVKDMEMHVKRHGTKDQACEICGNLFYCSLDLKRHLKIHSEPTISCDIQGCNKKFYTNSKLKSHIKVRHEGAKDFFCDYCSSRFSQYNNLKRHVNSVHKSLRINCLVPGCDYSVARKDKYKNHLAAQHKYLDDQTKESILKSVKFE